MYMPRWKRFKIPLDRINGYNTRSENPTHWQEEVYTGNDFFEKMIAEKRRPGGPTGMTKGRVQCSGAVW